MVSFVPLLVLGLVSAGSCSIYCGIAHGYDLGTNAYYYSGDGTLSNFDACSATCQGSSKCQSFAFGNNSCLLYSAPLTTNFRSQDNSPYLFYDRDCVNVKSTSSFATTLPPQTATAPAATVPATAPPATVPATATTAPTENTAPPATTSPGETNAPPTAASPEGTNVPTAASQDAAATTGGDSDQEGSPTATGSSSSAGSDAAATQASESSSGSAATGTTGTGIVSTGSKTLSTMRTGTSTSTATGTGASLQIASSSSGASGVEMPNGRWLVAVGAAAAFWLC